MVATKAQPRTKKRSGTRTQSSKGLKPYLYKVNEPLCPVPDIYTNTPYFYRYNSSLGSKTEPKAYVNPKGQTLAEYVHAHATRNNETTRTIGTKKFRTEESMLKALRDCTAMHLIVIPKGIFVDVLPYINSIEAQGTTGNFEKFVAWSKHEVYDGVIIDDPSLEDNELTEFTKSGMIPPEMVVEEIPRIYDMFGGNYGKLQHKMDELNKRMNDSRKKDRRYRVMITEYDLTEEDAKKILGTDIPDISIGDDKSVPLGHITDREVFAKVYRSNSAKPTYPYLPKVGDTVRTPRFLNVEIEDVFATYDGMIRAGYTEPTHYRGAFVVNGRTIDRYHMVFAASPLPPAYSLSKKAVRFNDSPWSALRKDGIRTGIVSEQKKSVSKTTPQGKKGDTHGKK